MHDYVLHDFGNSRRLEQFGDLILDRPCPAAAELDPREPDFRNRADAVFLAETNSRLDSFTERGVWKPLTSKGRSFFSESESKPWSISFELGRTIAHRSLELELRGTPFGHVGVFPEQWSNWRNIFKTVSETATSRSERIRILNLFAYTGGSSLAAASAAPEQVEVVHVDAAKPVVDWAKRNATLAGLGNARIRFIVDDVRKFVAREIRREKRYDGIILDPPSYGHGTRGEPWKIAEHLPMLVDELFRLWSEKPMFFLLTTHTPQFDISKLLDLVREHDFNRRFQCEPLSMNIATPTGRKLPSGCGIWGTG